MFVDAFLANYALHGDFAKSSKFAVLIFPPPGLQNSGGLFGGLVGKTKAFEDRNKLGFGKILNTASLSFQCESAVLPGYQINTIEQKIYGAPFTGGASPVFEPIQLTFICAGDMWERKFMEDWMEVVLPREPNKNENKFALNTETWFEAGDGPKRPPFSASYREEYVSTIQVIQFHETGIPSARYKFVEAYPVDMNPQPLNWGDDNIHRLQVTFHYRTYEREENIIKQVFSTFKNDPTGE
jgi:hypothetical protein